jgi:hypothetical protein
MRSFCSKPSVGCAFQTSIRTPSRSATKKPRQNSAEIGHPARYGERMDTSIKTLAEGWRQSLGFVLKPLAWSEDAET